MTIRLSAVVLILSATLAACGPDTSRTADAAAAAPAAPAPSATSTDGAEAPAGPAAAAPTGTSTFAGNLAANAWQLVALNAPDAPPPEGVADPLELRFEGDRVSGNGPCNGFSATVTVGDDTIAIGPIAATKRACDALPFERAYFDQLATTRTARIDDTGLVLVTTTGEIRYARAAAKP